MAWNDAQHARAGEMAQVSLSAEAAEGHDVGMLGLECLAVANPAKKDAGVANLVALFEKLLHQRQWFARSRPPYDMFPRANYGGEVELSRVDFLRHFLI